MKFHGAALLALATLHQASAFITPSPKLNSLTRTFSYLDDIQGKGERSGGEPEPPKPPPMGGPPQPANPMGMQPPKPANPMGMQPPKPANPMGMQPSQPANPMGKQPQEPAKAAGQPQPANPMGMQPPQPAKPMEQKQPQEPVMATAGATERQPAQATAGDVRSAPPPRVATPPRSYVDPSRGIGLDAPRQTNLARAERPAPPQAKIWEKAPPVIVQGGSLKTWSYASPSVERVQVVLQTEGRPLDADVDLWQGPDNTPHKMRVYCEDGYTRPFNVVIETPRGPNTIAVRNIGQMEFPLEALVTADTNPVDYTRDFREPPRTIQGGALRTYPFDPMVESVQVLLRTDGRPLNARIELLQGPNNNKQVIQVYTEDGLDRPFYVVLETPGSGNVVRIVNSATVEFPMTAWVEPLMVANMSPNQPVMGGDDGFIAGGRW